MTGIITDLTNDAAGGKPHLDVVVATHRHADHIRGFALREWDQVTVDEVWVPFVEDESDPQAQSLRRVQTEAARNLLSLINRRIAGFKNGSPPAAVADARSFTLNFLDNADAMDRLLGRNGMHFANHHNIRYLPTQAETGNEIRAEAVGVTAHILGPSRDPRMLRQMNPPARAGWLRLDTEDDEAEKYAGNEELPPLFNSDYILDQEDRLSGNLLKAKNSLQLHRLTNDAGLLSASSILERAVNNTSLFFVLDVEGTRLIFPGDAQYGAWEYVLQDATKKALLADAAFYKIGHHGSHNATPKYFVNEVWRDGGYAMLPWGHVKRWEKTIPKRELLEALVAHHHKIIQADGPIPDGGRVKIHGTLWSEVELPQAREL
ncbi:hypothetical protein ACIP9X_21605 [Arthrobacter sp. NPDC093125]|uniref:hypothetical protein n=1 Tax=Arthrobacter sp. NPDC093125 TaxID=3363944 RepID=UPI0037FA10DB